MFYFQLLVDYQSVDVKVVLCCVNGRLYFFSVSRSAISWLVCVKSHVSGCKCECYFKPYPFNPRHTVLLNQQHWSSCVKNTLISFWRICIKIHVHINQRWKMNSLVNMSKVIIFIFVLLLSTFHKLRKFWSDIQGTSMHIVTV